MQHAPRPARFVQAIDVLGDDHHLTGPTGLKPGQRQVRRVGARFGGSRTPRVVKPLNQSRIAGESFGRGHIL